MKTKATRLIFNTESAPKIQEQIDRRALKFKKEIGFTWHQYSNPIEISVLDKYVDTIINYFETKNVFLEIDERTPIFRVQDFAFVQRQSYYRVIIEHRRIISNLDRYKEQWNLNMDPDFQRGYIWSDMQKIAYIEFLLSGGTTGREIYFNAPGWGKGNADEPMVLVDGKQRLNAIISFMKGEFEVFAAANYSDLTWSDRENLDIYFNVNDLEDPKDVIRWYLGMNTGGAIHTEEDLQPAYNALKNLKK